LIPEPFAKSLHLWCQGHVVPEFIGQGLGKYFLNWTIDKAWSYQPRRFWLHTCTLDHPAAVSTYL